MSYIPDMLIYPARKSPLALNTYLRDLETTQLYQEITFGFLSSLIMVKNESPITDTVFLSYDGANVAHEVDAGQTIELRPVGTNHLFFRAEEGGHNLKVIAS